MFAHRKILALAAPVLLLGACTGDYRGLESAHQPVVSRTDYVFDVATSGYGLAPGEAGRLAGWMASLRVGYGDTVAIDDPSGGGTVRQDVAAQVAGRGLLLSDAAPVTAGPVTPGTIRIVVSRAAANVPGCPDFRTDVSGYANFDAHTSSNYGCGVNATFAKMVANPVDLVRGQPGEQQFDTRTGSKAIQAMRSAAPSGAGGTQVKTESTGGK